MCISYFRHHSPVGSTIPDAEESVQQLHISEGKTRCFPHERISDTPSTAGFPKLPIFSGPAPTGDAALSSEATSVITWTIPGHIAQCSQSLPYRKMARDCTD